MKVGNVRAVLSFALLFHVVGCSPASESPSADSKSHWLGSCADDAECSDELTCLCGVCSLSCRQDDDCSGTQPARCLQPEAYAECPSLAGGENVCLAACEDSDDCSDGQLCIRNICVAEATPEASICEPTNDWSDVNRLLEVQVLNRINVQRAEGTECSLMSFQASEPLVIDFRLRCAARLHVDEMMRLDYYNEVSPDGTQPDIRMNRSGHPAEVWGIVIGEGTSDESVREMMDEFCDWLSDPGFTDVGVGSHGDLWSINLAGPDPDAPE